MTAPQAKKNRGSARGHRPRAAGGRKFDIESGGETPVRWPLRCGGTAADDGGDGHSAAGREKREVSARTAHRRRMKFRGAGLRDAGELASRVSVHRGVTRAGRRRCCCAVRRRRRKICLLPAAGEKESPAACDDDRGKARATVCAGDKQNESQRPCPRAPQAKEILRTRSKKVCPTRCQRRRGRAHARRRRWQT